MVGPRAVLLPDVSVMGQQLPFNCTLTSLLCFTAWGSALNRCSVQVVQHALVTGWQQAKLKTPSLSGQLVAWKRQLQAEPDVLAWTFCRHWHRTSSGL